MGLFWFYLIASEVSGAVICSVTCYICFSMAKRLVKSDWSPKLKPLIEVKTLNFLDKIKEMFPFASSFLVGKTGDTLRNFAEEEIISMIPQVQAEVLSQLKWEKKWFFFTAAAGAVMGLLFYLIAVSIQAILF